MTTLVLLSRVAYRDQEITRPRLRSLLALLAGELRTGTGTNRLVDELWADHRPENPTKALRVLVSQARSALGADLIASTPGGYRLALREDQVDAAALALAAAASARHARAGDHLAALEHAEAGLALWDGPADAEPGDPLGDLRVASASTYRSLVRARALALARLGRHAESLDALTGVLRERPHDEEVLAELLRGEAATAGPAAALARYDTYRRAVREELGGDPGPALRQLHQRLLVQDRPAVRHGVVHDPNPLLGRDADLAAVADLLRTSRVTSIVGAGGLGKTRLAHALSRAARQRAVYFVPLAGLAPDGDVPAQVASVLGVGEAGPAGVGRAPVAASTVGGIVGAVGSGPALLVLDNCEHVVTGAAALVRTLVSMCGELRVLTTSRAPLGLSSESVYQLPELGLATAVELFGQRAMAARPGVDLPPGTVRVLCAHLDGLPLAVELAAARVRVMSAGEIADGLADRFGLLRGGARDAPERHRTLHAVIDWSWNLLEPAGQAAMRALSVFPAGFATGAAAAVLDAGGDVLPVLEQLVDQSLLKVTDTAAGTRFQMLETVREFSAARRAEAGETDTVTDRFLNWAKDFGLANHESIFTGDPLPAMDRLRAEQDNLSHALRVGLDRADGDVVAATTAALGTLSTAESNLARMSGVVEEIGAALARYRPEPALVEVTRAAAVLVTVHTFLLRGPRATRSLVALRRLPPPAPADTLVRATDLVLRAIASGSRTALDALCDNENPLVASVAGHVLSYVREYEDDLDRALSAARAMVAAVEHAGNPWITALASSRLGELCMRADLGEEARRHLLSALRLVEGFGAWSSATRVRWALALACLQCGAVDDAERWLERALREGGDAEADSIGLGMDIAVRAEINLARGEVDTGLDLWRRTVDRLHDGAAPSWELEARAVTVVAHARHGRLDLVEDIAGDLRRALSALLTSPRPGASYVDLPVGGALLLALAMTDLDAAERTGDRSVARSAARMIALAERFRCVRGFQPTMSAEHARLLARRADRPAYDDAVSSYAGLRGESLRAAAATVLRERFSGVPW